jgi:fatty-acyl-CoA synthase
MEQMEQMGFTIIHVYGLTETNGPYAVCEPQPAWDGIAPEERARLMSRQGVGMVHTDGLRVVESQLRDGALVDVAADGQAMGEIVMRGNGVMKGYFKDPEGTQKAFAGGWFHSGDLGVMHLDGYVELRDRAKDVVVSGGENIATIEVESGRGSPAVRRPARSSSWPNCPRPPRARSRSSTCARRNGLATSAGSTAE